MVIRTFFDKNNTVVYDNSINTGKNPVAELFYGGYDTNNDHFSRFIFHFDEKRIKDLYNDGYFCDLDGGRLTHKIRLTNTGSFDTDLLGKTTCGGKCRSSSFDLVLFPLDQHWDEGVGYDYGSCGYLSQGDAVTCAGPSNWNLARTNEPWTGNSMYIHYCNSSTGSTSGNTPTFIDTQHFEDGNENIEFDVTDIVNGILTGDTNYGFGIAYKPHLECESGNNLQYVGFFTRHTQTFYEPFLETIYNNPILDDRSNFYMDKINKIYLYVNAGGEPTNLDYSPTLTVRDGNDNIITYTSTTFNCSTGTTSYVGPVTCVSKGVYSAEVFISSSDYGGGDCIDFTDTWGDICINGIKRPDIELDFIIKDPTGYYNIGDNDSLPKKYGLKVTGINSGERIKRGDVRRINVSARIPYTINQTDIIDGLEYRLYVKEGRNQFTVIDFQPINRTHNGNYFYIDTESLIPNTYFLDVKVRSHNEVTTLTEALSFDIVSQSEMRISQ